MRMPIRGVRLHTGLLALALCSGAQVLANPFLQQQYLIGDVYPYDYSPEDFRTATSNPAVQDTFPVPGYDITAGNGSTSTTTRDFRLDGWRLAVSVSSDVAIPGNSPDSQGGSKVFHTAQLSLTPPTRLSDALKKDSADQNWSVCSAIWTLGLSQTALDAASKSGSGSGSGGPASSCSGFLPSECISEMEAGFNTAGFCQNQTMPASCTVFFANGTDGVTRGSNLPQTIGGMMGDGAFFAASTRPLDKGDKAVLTEVRAWVFPVVLSWTYKGSQGANGPAGDTLSHLSCVRAAADGGGSAGADSGNGIGNGSSRLRAGWLPLMSVGLAAGVVLVLL